MSKQVIVMRTRFPDGKGGFFKPRKGKMIAQGAHASMKVFLDRGEVLFDSSSDDPDNPYYLDIALTEAMREWIEGLFTKVCLQVDDDEKLLGIYHQARDAGLPCALIEDSGKTEFHGVKTVTCCAIGPADAEAIDKITGHLKLL